MDVDRWRSETPGCADKVYLAGAGTALPVAATHEAMASYLAREVELGGYQAQWAAADLFAGLRADLTRLLGAESGHVALAESGTHAWWRALGALGLSRGDRVVVSDVEYLGTLLPLVQRGVQVEVLPVSPDGTVDLARAADHLAGAQAVIACHAASHVGSVLDVGSLAAIRADVAPGAWFVVDACQSAGQLPLDAARWRADVVFGTGRKWLRGPRGTGFLAVGNRVLDRTPEPLDTNTGSLTSGEPMPAAGIQRFEPFEAAWASHAGLAAAVRWLLDTGPSAVHQRIAELATGLRGRLDGLPDVEVLDRGPAPGGIVTFRHHRYAATDVAAAADAAGVVVGTSTPHPAPLDPDMTGPVVRVGAHVYNDEADLDRLAEVLADL